MEAKRGDRSAQYFVGMAYLTGDRVEVNPEKAVMYLGSAAAGGVAEAQVQLGLVLLEGEVVARNVPQGIALIGAASQQAAFDADQNYAIGQALLGEEGTVMEDPSERAKWAAHYFDAAAGESHPQASYEIGRMFLFGRGVERDPEKAAVWVSAAANEGVRDAQYLMGALLQSGTGVEKNTEWAAHWFVEAARRGCESAALALECGPEARAALEMAKLEFVAKQCAPSRKAFVRELRALHHPDRGGNEEIFAWAQSLWEKEYR
jgi:TPR repeat protein